MAKAKNYIPEGFHTVSTFLVLNGAEDFINFVKKIDGEETYSLKGPDGTITHANVKIGDTTIMLGDTMGEMEQQVAMFYVYVKDADASYKKAIEAGGKSFREPKDEFYGDRAGAVKDKWGNTWWFATLKEEVDQAELQRRAEETYRKQRQEQPVH